MASTTSDLIVERLLDWGVDTCFGINGDQVNGFFEALRTRSERMRFVHVRHEENAALAAVGHAKFSGRPAACVATAGPGAVHLLNGVYDAHIDAVPLIAISGMSYHDLIGAHLIQDLDSPALFGDACEFSERVMGPSHRSTRPTSRSATRSPAAARRTWASRSTSSPGPRTPTRRRTRPGTPRWPRRRRSRSRRRSSCATPPRC